MNGPVSAGEECCDAISWGASAGCARGLGVFYQRSGGGTGAEWMAGSMAGHDGGARVVGAGARVVEAGPVPWAPVSSGARPCRRGCRRVVGAGARVVEAGPVPWAPV